MTYRPRLMQGFKFQTQPPIQLDKFSSQDVVIHNSDQISSGLKIDDESNSDSEQESRQHQRDKHLEELRMKKRPSFLVRKSMQEVGETTSPLLIDDKYNCMSNPISPGESYTRHNFNDQKMSSTDIYNEGFYRNEKGSLMCENYEVQTIAKHMVQGCSPFYLMSRGLLNKNYQAYEHALEGIQSFVGYAVKANHNLNLLKYLASMGCGAVVVSGCELQTALIAGFSRHKMVFDGSGKTQAEINLAVENGILVNIESEFDLEHIIKASQQTCKKARTILKINPDIDPIVHPNVSKCMGSSQFGIQKLPNFLERIQEYSENVSLVGIHCHLDSTFKEVAIFRDAAILMLEIVEQIRSEGFELQYLNIGGGPGMDYERKQESVGVMPTPIDLINSIKDLLQEMNIKLIIEPGRSLVANTCIFVTKVVGIKSNGTKNFIVVDGSMSEPISPSLQNSYHHIEFAENIRSQTKKQDIFGPMCESADFLGKDRELPVPREGDILVVYDAGAYCQSMSSVNNMRLTCAEFWVEGTMFKQIRKPLNLMTYLQQFECLEDQTSPRSIKYKQAAKPLKLMQDNDCDSKSQEEHNTQSKPFGIGSQYNHRSTLDKDSINVIDECDEDQCVSPERGDQNIKFMYNSHSEIKLRNLSASRSNKQKEGSEQYSFYIESSSSESYKEKKIKDSAEENEEESYDSEEEDRKFLEKQQEIEMKKEFQKLNEKSDKIPIALNSMFMRKDTPKFYKEQKEDRFDDEEFQSPTFPKKGPITPQKDSNFNQTDQKEANQLIKSPVTFMSQRKLGRPAPFEIKAMNYNFEEFNELSDEMNLTQNNGGEIDLKQLTNKKGEGTILSQENEYDTQSYPTIPIRGSFSAMKTKDNSDLLASNVKDRMQGLRSINIGTSSQGIKGLGSAGVRLAGSRILNKPGSSTSSKRDEFRNKILQNKAGNSLSNFEAFNKFKNVDNASSVSSRFVMKLQGNDSDAEIVSQQENEYKNAFEKTYNEFEALGEGCSSVVKRCEHKFLKQIRAVKIIRNDDPEYIQNAQNEYKILKNINNSLIVKMFDCIHDFEKGTLYLIMEYIEGETIEDYTLRILSENTGFITESIIKKIFKQIVQAVEIIHEHGICHRDLKPDNLLYNSKTGIVKLMDFNISKRFRHEVKQQEAKDKNKKTPIPFRRNQSGDINQVIGISLQNYTHKPKINENKDSLKDLDDVINNDGTPKRITMRTLTGLDCYSAPETRQGGEYTEAIDLWGIGILLYYIITGHPPFIHHDETKLKQKVQNCQYEPFSKECLKYYSAESIELIKNLIVVDPSQRYTLQQVKESDWYKMEIESSNTTPISFEVHVSPKKSENKVNQFVAKASVDMNRRGSILKEKQESTVDFLTELRESQQPSLEIQMNKKRDPAVIRNKKSKSRERIDRKLSFLNPQVTTNNTPNSHKRNSPRLSIELSEQEICKKDQKFKSQIVKVKDESINKKGEASPLNSLIKLHQITPQGGYSSDEELEEDDFLQNNISFSNKNLKYIKQKTETFKLSNYGVNNVMRKDSGYEHEEVQTFELKNNMKSKMRKKSQKTKVNKKKLAKILKLRSMVVDEKKQYKELDFELTSPKLSMESKENAIEYEKKLDQMLLENNDY